MSRKLSSRPALRDKMMRLWSEYHHTPTHQKGRRRHLKRAAIRCAEELQRRA